MKNIIGQLPGASPPGPPPPDPYLNCMPTRNRGGACKSNLIVYIYCFPVCYFFRIRSSSVHTGVISIIQNLNVLAHVSVCV